MAKYRIVQTDKVIAIKKLVLAVLGPPRYREMGQEEFKRLYPDIPSQLLQKAAQELIAEGKIEKV